MRSENEGGCPMRVGNRAGGGGCLPAAWPVCTALQLGPARLA